MRLFQWNREALKLIKKIVSYLFLAILLLVGILLFFSFTLEI